MEASQTEEPNSESDAADPEEIEELNAAPQNPEEQPPAPTLVPTSCPATPAPLEETEELDPAQQRPKGDECPETLQTEKPDSEGDDADLAGTPVPSDTENRLDAEQVSRRAGQAWLLLHRKEHVG